MTKRTIPLWPPDPEMRSPRNGGNRARAKAQIEVLNGFSNTLSEHQAQRRNGLSRQHAGISAALQVRAR